VVIDDKYYWNSQSNNAGIPYGILCLCNTNRLDTNRTLCGSGTRLQICVDKQKLHRCDPQETFVVRYLDITSHN